MTAGASFSFATPKSSPRRAAPAREAGVILWLRENLFGSVQNTVMTLLALWALFVTIPDFMMWAFVDAVWQTEDPGLCRQAAGACWAVVAEKHRVMLFGTFPYEEHWRAVLAIAVILAMAVASAFKRFWSYRLFLSWLLATAAVLVLLLGGVRHAEQDYNLRGARSFLAVIVPLSVVALVLPDVTTSSPGPTLSTFQAIFLAGITAVLYVVFLGIQTVRHRGFFVQPAATDEDDAHAGHASGSVTYHAIMLFLTLLPIVLLSKQLATLVDHGIDALAAPTALGGLLVAILVLTPEGLAAVRSALDNKLQRAVNICLGSALSTIGLTVPAIVVISLVTGHAVTLGLTQVNMVLLLLTLFVSALTFGGVRTNVLQGAVHLVLFFVYLVLIFQP